MRHNAIKHGLLSRQVLLPCEDGSELEELYSSLRADLRPRGSLQDALLDQMVAALWRLRRVLAIEAAILQLDSIEHQVREAEGEARGYERHRPSENDLLMTALLGGRQVEVTDAEAHRRALQRARDLTSLACEPRLMVGRTFRAEATQGDSFVKLSRYAASLERSFYRAADRLETLRSQVRKTQSS